jgi:hypothetical protein
MPGDMASHLSHGSSELHGDRPSENQEDWGGAVEVMDDPDEQRVLFAALDSFQ